MFRLMTTPRLATIFALIATLPLLLLGFSTWLGGIMPIPVQDQWLLVFYSLVLLSFLAGGYWQRGMAAECTWLLGFALLMALVPFSIIGITFFQPVEADYIYLWLGVWFLIALSTDWQLYRQKDVAYDYLRVRTAFTILVLISLIAAGLAPVEPSAY